MVEAQNNILAQAIPPEVHLTSLVMSVQRERLKILHPAAKVPKWNSG